MCGLSKIIAEEIRKKGPVSFARFMDLALYCPVYGYYERDADSVGRGGDFLTSVSVGPMFGELLAARFASWLDETKRLGAGRLHLVEAGGHDGQLALDILGWLERWRPDLFSKLTYHLLEPSNTRQRWQRKKLESVLNRVCWSSSFNDLSRNTGGVCGVFFSNEILDSLPLHRFGWDRSKRAWFEWLVGERDGQFVWIRGRPPEEGHQAAIDRMVAPELLDLLPDGYVIEKSLAASQWWRDAAGTLEQGWLMTLDYGFDMNEAVTPERTTGTLRGYHHHQVTSDVLASPGEQDLTAHVDFGQIRNAGEECGLSTEFFGGQDRFLVQLLEHSIQCGLRTHEMDPQQVRQFKTLIHPDHFGRSFRVLVQTKQP